MTCDAANWSPDTVRATYLSSSRPLNVVGVVLAGGASRRMGGRPKALLPWPRLDPTTTFLGSIWGAFDQAGVATLAVVTGRHHDEIIAAAAWPVPGAVLFNERHAEGQLSSIWSGIEWAEGLDPPPEWLAVALVDAPGVRPETIRLLCDTASAGCDVGRGRETLPLVVRPAIGARHGHPVLWHRAAWPMLRAAPLAGGARTVVRALASDGRVCDVQVDDSAVLRDIDSDTDYRALP